MVEFGAESIPGAEMQAQRLIDALRRSPDYIAKPLDVDKLLSLVRVWIGP